MKEENLEKKLNIHFKEVSQNKDYAKELIDRGLKCSNVPRNFVGAVPLLVDGKNCALGDTPIIDYLKDGITLSWTASTDPDGDTITYEVYADIDDPTPSTLRVTTSSTSVTITDYMSISANQHIYWYVRAVTNYSSNNSPVADFYTPYSTAPVIEEWGFDKSIAKVHENVNFYAYITDAEGDDVKATWYLGTYWGNQSTLYKTTPNWYNISATFGINPDDVGQIYYYIRLKAVDDNLVESDWTSFKELLIYGLPYPPEGFTLIPNGAYAIDLFWYPPDMNESIPINYTIIWNVNNGTNHTYWTDNDDPNWIKHNTTGYLHFTHTNLSTDAYYTYYLRANTDYHSATQYGSDWVKQSIFLKYQPPIPPDLEIYNKDTGEEINGSYISTSYQIELRWRNGTTCNITQYKIYMLRVGDTVKLIKTLPPTANSYTINSNITEEGEYIFYIKSVDDRGNESNQSNLVYIFVDNTPPQIKSYNITLTSSFVDISYDVDDANFDKVLITIYHNSIGDIPSLTNLNYTSKTNSLTLNYSFEVGETYHIKITAIDKAGNTKSIIVEKSITSVDVSSKIDLIWIKAKYIVKGKPFNLTVVFDKDAKINILKVIVDSQIFTLNKIKTHKFAGSVTIAEAGEVEITIEGIDEDGNVISFTFPLTVEDVTPVGEKLPSIILHSKQNDTYAIVFSDTVITPSIYKDENSIYHLTFETSPSTKILIDATNLEPTLKKFYLISIGNFRLFHISYFDKKYLTLKIHNFNQDFQIKLSTQNLKTIYGYNNFWAKYFHLGRKFNLVDSSAGEIILEGYTDEVKAKYKAL